MEVSNAFVFKGVQSSIHSIVCSQQSRPTFVITILAHAAVSHEALPPLVVVTCERSRVGRTGIDMLHGACHHLPPPHCTPFRLAFNGMFTLVSTQKPTLRSYFVSEPVWPSGRAPGW